MRISGRSLFRRVLASLELQTPEQQLIRRFIRPGMLRRCGSVLSITVLRRCGSVLSITVLRPARTDCDERQQGGSHLGKGPVVQVMSLLQP